MCESKTKEYACWKNMRGRCYVRTNVSFADYGGRGIGVCSRWRNDYQNFLGDMGRSPSRAHSIDRKDPNGNYEPGNCHWATKLGQVLNRRMLRNNTSGITGVSWHRRERRWRAQAAIDGNNLSLGHFKGMESAGLTVRTATLYRRAI